MRGECSSAQRLSSALHDRRYALASLMRKKTRQQKQQPLLTVFSFAVVFPKTATAF